MLPLLICIAIVTSDQLTKTLIQEHILYGSIKPIIPSFMNLTHLRNTGAAWGMFDNHNFTLMIFSVIMLVLIVIFRKSFLGVARADRIAFGLLTGGIIGNLIDRIKLGFVVDFLDFYIASWHWPSFNIADSAICVGVSIYVISSLFTSRNVLSESDET